ncbi:MAG: tetratricopeptide repeat protein [Desulfobacterales bacterium]
MSLLNDALRKHRQEREGARKRPWIPPTAAAARRRRPRPIWLIAVVMAAAGLLAPLWQATGTRGIPAPPPFETPENRPPAVLAEPASATAKPSPEGNHPTASIAAPGRVAAALPPAPATAARAQKAAPTAAVRRTAAALAAAQKPAAAPTDDSPFYQKAMALHRQQRFSEAIEFYRQVLAQNPDHPACRFNLATAYIDSGAFKDAYPLLKALAASAPQNPDIQLNLAIAEIGTGRMEAAAASLDMAEALPEAPEFEIHFHRGILHGRSDRPQAAIASYRQAGALRPRHSGVLFNLAVTFDRLTEYPTALAYYVQSLSAGDGVSTSESDQIRQRIQQLQTYLNASADAAPDLRS